MAEESRPSRNANRPRLKLDTLVRLRWLAVAGQTATVVVVHYWLGFPMPLGLCLGAIALSAWLNLFLKIRYPSSLRLRGSTAALLLGYDVLQLSALLYLTGGLQNPFSILLIVPVMVSATTLDPRLTTALGALVLVAVSVLAIHHLPLPWPASRSATAHLCRRCLGGARLRRLLHGQLRLPRRARIAQLAEALTATELVLAREQHLSALDGLAAAGAH